MKQFGTFTLVLTLLASAAFAQRELLTNAEIVDMARSGLPASIILRKISDSDGNFDVSVRGLIALRDAGVGAEVIEAMMAKPAATKPEKTEPPKAAVEATTRTVAIEKSSLNPSRQALEKELLKRKEWERLNLSIVRYKDSADLYIEIGFVPLSLITHRYVFRIYERRTGTVLAAGETTSWGSLARNLAREIAKKLDATMSRR